MGDVLVKAGFALVSGGTDTHLILVDLRPKKLTGNISEKSMERAHITCNKNGVPFDPEKPMVTSGIRLGAPAGTTRGFGEAEFRDIGRMIAEVLDGLAKNGEAGNAQGRSRRSRTRRPPSASASRSTSSRPLALHRGTCPPTAQVPGRISPRRAGTQAMPTPYAQLNIFRPDRGRGMADAVFVSSQLGIESTQGRSHKGWVFSTEGCVQSHSLTAHVDALLRTLSGKCDALQRLRAEGYWVCVFFHDTRPPDATEVSAIASALEERDITFDFELERDREG